VTRREVRHLALGGLATAGVLLAPSYARVLAAPAPTVGTVAQVTDGDTVRVAIGLRVDRVRLLGVDAPEMGYFGNPRECHAVAARAHLRRLVPVGKRVWLQRDARQPVRDRYGRRLAYVYRAKGAVGSMATVNRWLVLGGSARSRWMEFGPMRWGPAFDQAELTARALKRGLWGRCQDGARHG
jgi:micrococcal nuclease